MLSHYKSMKGYKDYKNQTQLNESETKQASKQKNTLEDRPKYILPKEEVPLFVKIFRFIKELIIVLIILFLFGIGAYYLISNL